MDEKQLYALRKKAVRGARRLDREWPGWEQCVIPHTVMMIDERACVLTQAFGNFWLGLHVLQIYTTAEADAHGFFVDRAEDEEEEWEMYARLSGIWAALVLKRWKRVTFSPLHRAA